MVERIILIKLHDPSQRDRLSADALALLSRLSDVEACSVGVPADEACAKSWDLSIVLGFANAALLDKVLASTLYESFVESTLSAHVAVQKAWSFQRLA